MISQSDRETAVELINEAIASGARQEPACKILGICAKTFQRWFKDGKVKPDGRPDAERKTPHNKLTREEEDQLQEILYQDEYVDLPPSQIVPKLADKGIYLASESTIYRIMRRNKLNKHRNRGKQPTKHSLTTHIAIKPNQVWTWDITYLGSPIKGKYYYLYTILDIFSRKVVGWEVWESESADHAKRLFEIATHKENIEKWTLVLHSDNGPTMKAKTFRAKLESLGIETSYSRPRVSNDNPYSESQFRTMKYCPSYPVHGFTSIDEARNWVANFVTWYNDEHCHSGINFVSPSQVHNGEYVEILENRKSVYEAAKAQNPSRWTTKTRNWTPHTEVTLNPTRETLLNA